MRKIDILHVAINYIKALESLLDTGEVGEHVFANSIYAIAGGEDEEETAVRDGGETGSCDSYSDTGTNYEEEEDTKRNHPTSFPFFSNPAGSSPRRITLSSRESQYRPPVAAGAPPPAPRPPNPCSGLGGLAYNMSLNCKVLTAKEIEQKPFSGLEELSDMSTSDPEDLFSDLNSSLESLNHLEGFSFFTDRHLPTFTI